mgnify:CR=1 FL=1
MSKTKKRNSKPKNKNIIKLKQYLENLNKK